MSPVYREIGIDITAEDSTSNPLGPLVITEDLGTRGKMFLLGVAYSDTDNNDFYSVGEGRSDLVISRAGASVTSSSSGGYSLELVSGAQS